MILWLSLFNTKIAHEVGYFCSTDFISFASTRKDVYKKQIFVGGFFFFVTSILPPQWKSWHSFIDLQLSMEIYISYLYVLHIHILISCITQTCRDVFIYHKLPSSDTGWELCGGSTALPKRPWDHLVTSWSIKPRHHNGLTTWAQPRGEGKEPSPAH